MNKFKKLIIIAIVAILLILALILGISSLVKNNNMKSQTKESAKAYLKDTYGIDVELKYDGKEYHDINSEGINKDNVYYTYTYVAPGSENLELKVEVLFDKNTKTTSVTKLHNYSVFTKKLEIKDKVAQILGSDYTLNLDTDLYVINAKTEKDFKDSNPENVSNMCEELKSLVVNTDVVIDLEYAENSINGVDEVIEISYSTDDYENMLITKNIEDLIQTNTQYLDLISTISIYANAEVINYTNVKITDTYNTEKYGAVIDSVKTKAAQYDMPISISFDDNYAFVKVDGSVELANN